MVQYVALLRGINVGRSNRISMVELRGVIENLGFSKARTLLNSGNAVFQGEERSNTEIALSLEDAINDVFGFSVRVVVITSDELNNIIAENPLKKANSAPSKFLVSFFTSSGALDSAKSLLKEDWSPEEVSFGSQAAYLFCADGIKDSRLAKAFARGTSGTATNRNWATILKLQKILTL